ncbi:MAG: hypothetical protein M3T55_05560 [Pseudomonadota bacterium]|nr:hypothetical protein [Pseudomonadota bacterium]
MTGDRTGRAGEARDAFGERIDELRETVQQKAAAAKGAAQHLYGRAADRAQGLAGNVDTMIDDQPYIALAVAAVAGLAVGLVLGLSLGRD